MKKLKLFLENFLIYGMGGVISKMIPLIMVPIVTRIMPNSEYFGISDLCNTVLSFASAVAVLGMYDAMYRMFFERNELEYKKDICSTALIFTLGTSILVAIILVIFRKNLAAIVFDDERYHYLVYIIAIETLVSATNQIISAPTRMQNKRKIFLITNTISPLLSYGVSIPLLLKGYYTIALPVAGTIAGLTQGLIFFALNHRWFQGKRFNIKLLWKLLNIAIPLFPNFVVYWLFNSADKLMITNLLGLDAAGVYSVGAKLGHASQLIRTAFGGGWQYFAFSTMHEEDQVKSNSMVFEYLGLISFVCAMFVFALAKPIYQLLFELEYVEGYIVSPYLFLAPLLQMLFQVIANQFIVIEKTWPNVLILSVGVVVNIFLNIIFIPILGIEGAGIATLTGYVVSDIICVFVLHRMELMVISKRFIIMALGLVVYIIVWRLFIKEQVYISVLFSVMFSAFFLWLYRKDIAILLKEIRNR